MPLEVAKSTVACWEEMLLRENGEVRRRLPRVALGDRHVVDRDLQGLAVKDRHRAVAAAAPKGADVDGVAARTHCDAKGRVKRRHRPEHAPPVPSSDTQPAAPAFWVSAPVEVLRSKIATASLTVEVT